MNAAGRLLQIHGRLMQQSVEMTSLHAWAGAFEVPLDTPQLEDEVAMLLMALRSEVKFARARLDAYDLPAELTCCRRPKTEPLFALMPT